MSTFVLIHGAWHGGWCYDQLRPLLEAEGHEVITPDLPCMGGTDEELAAVTLQGWAEFVADLCRNATQKPVILAGHSRAGVVIGPAAEIAPEAIDALVYICAMLVPRGMSRAEFREQQVSNPDFMAIRLPHPSGKATIIDKANAIPVFAQLSPRNLAEAAVERLVAEPNAPTETKLELTDERFGSVPRHYIECLHDRTIPIQDQRTMQELTPCRTVTALDADHSPFLSTPEDLAAALLKIAANPGG
jgi:pimeloyl-ACP methyl ester carboxylesterase